MLLIDGIPYKEWIPEGERAEEELERMVKEHANEIFGEQSIYIDRKQKLKSLSGIGSIPDGYVIILGTTPQWHVVEVELSSHPLHDHIISQVGRFISGINNPNIQRGIVNAIDEEIARDDFLKLRLRKAIEPAEIYRFLSDLTSKQPTLTIIIEKDTGELTEALNTLRYPQIKVVEFRTFLREDAETVHAHLFKPLYEPAISISLGITTIQPLENSFEIVLKHSYITQQYFHVPKAKKSLFPKNGIIELDAGNTVLKTQFHDYEKNGQWLQNNLDEWFNTEPKPKVGDKIRISVIEPMKKYRLEIVK